MLWLLFNFWVLCFPKFWLLISRLLPSASFSVQWLEFPQSLKEFLGICSPHCCFILFFHYLLLQVFRWTSPDMTASRCFFLNTIKPMCTYNGVTANLASAYLCSWETFSWSRSFSAGKKKRRWVSTNRYKQPSCCKPDGLGDSRQRLGDWWRINGRLTAEWSRIMLIFEWLLWTSGDFQLLHSGATQWTVIHSTNEHAILNNFPHNDGATHAEIFRAQFSSPIRLWKDS